MIFLISFYKRAGSMQHLLSMPLLLLRGMSCIEEQAGVTINERRKNRVRNIPRQDCERRDGYKKKRRRRRRGKRLHYQKCIFRRERDNKIIKVESIRERSSLVDPPGGRSLLYRDVSDPLLFQQKELSSSGSMSILI